MGGTVRLWPLLPGRSLSLARCRRSGRGDGDARSSLLPSPSSPPPTTTLPPPFPKTENISPFCVDRNLLLSFQF